jgi:prepilin-type N-terminal cleavage/methylation domain-containing protein
MTRPSRTVKRSWHDRYRDRDRDDAGMTLVELLIASALLVVLLTAVALTMSVAEAVNTNVSSQYQEFQQAVPALAPLQALLRAEVEPGPASGSGVPQPGFASVGNFSLTFYANIGTAYNNVTTAGTTAGPAKIVAQEVDANGSPVTSATTCSTSSLCNFQVLEYLPVTNAGVSTCPGVSPSGTACQYPATGKLLVNVVGVTNNPSQGASAPPIFSYNVLNTTTGTATNLSYATVQSGLSCTGASATACPADSIQSVTVELQVGRKGAGTNGTVDEVLVVYRYAGSNGSSSYPYLYSSAVG